MGVLGAAIKGFGKALKAAKKAKLKTVHKIKFRMFLLITLFRVILNCKIIIIFETCLN